MRSWQIDTKKGGSTSKLCMSRKWACIVTVSIVIWAWGLTGARYRVNNAEEVACCTRVNCAKQDPMGTLLGKNDCWRHETVLI